LDCEKDSYWICSDICDYFPVGKESVFKDHIINVSISQGNAILVTPGEKSQIACGCSNDILIDCERKLWVQTKDRSCTEQVSPILAFGEMWEDKTIVSSEKDVKKREDACMIGIAMVSNCPIPTMNLTNGGLFLSGGGFDSWVMANMGKGIFLKESSIEWSETLGRNECGYGMLIKNECSERAYFSGTIKMY
jgi:hypothetical protein